MFAEYKDNIYRFVKNPRTKKYEVLTNIREKFYPEFTEYKTGAYKEVTLETSELINIFDVSLWVKYACGVPVSKCKTPADEWLISLDGHCVVLDDAFEFKVERGEYIWGWDDKIPFKDITLAWVQYKYIKKDGVILDEPLVVREDISIEKLIELRNYYGGEF